MRGEGEGVMVTEIHGAVQHAACASFVLVRAAKRIQKQFRVPHGPWRR